MAETTAERGEGDRGKGSPASGNRIPGPASPILGAVSGSWVLRLYVISFFGLLWASGTLSLLSYFLLGWPDRQIVDANGNPSPLEFTPNQDYALWVTVVFVCCVFACGFFAICWANNLKRFFRNQENFFEEQKFDQLIHPARSESENVIIESVKDALEQAFPETQESYDRSFKPMSPTEQRWRHLRRIFKIYENKNEIADALRSVPQELDGDRPAISILNFFLMVTLFAGIIGTFLGLMAFLTSDALENLVGPDANGSGSQIDRNKIKEAMDMFQPAFASSLVAYASYVFVRLERDLLDERFAAAVAAFNRKVQRPLIDLLPRTVAKQSIDVRLDDASLNELKQMVEVAKKTNEGLENLVVRVETLSKDLSDSSKTLQETTTSLEGSLVPFTTQLRRSVAGLRKAESSTRKIVVEIQTTLSEQAATVRSAISESGEALTRSAEKAAGSLQQVSGNLDDAAVKVELAVQSFSTSFEGMEDALSHGAETSRAFRDILDEVHAAQADLTESSRTLRAEIAKIPERLEDATAKFGHDIEQLPRLVAAAHAKLDPDWDRRVQQIADSLGDTASAFHGTTEALDRMKAVLGAKAPDDILTVLSDLKDQAKRIADSKSAS